MNLLPTQLYQETCTVLQNLQQKMPGYEFDELSVALSFALLSVAPSSGEVKAAAAAKKEAPKKEAPKKEASKKAASDDFDDLFGDDEPETPAAAPAPAAKKADDDMGNMFDEDDDLTEEEKAATAARRARMEQARKLKEQADAAKGGKAKKEKEAEKSLVVLEVKPWEADTDLEALWKEIIKFEKEGLTWGQTFKLEPVAYGIKKLVLTCSIVDALVLMDDVTENIEAMEDYVQSVEVASMNKI